MFTGKRFLSYIPNCSVVFIEYPKNQPLNVKYFQKIYKNFFSISFSVVVLFFLHTLNFLFLRVDEKKCRETILFYQDDQSRNSQLSMPLFSFGLLKYFIVIFLSPFAGRASLKVFYKRLFGALIKLLTVLLLTP